MRAFWWKAVRVSIVAAILVVAAGCGSSQIRVGWAGTSVPGHIAYSYTTFTGTEEGTQSLSSGQTLVVSYEAQVEKGTLTIHVAGPDGEMVEEAVLEESGSGTLEVTAPEEGTYGIVVRGEDAGGSFDVTWTTSP